MKSDFTLTLGYLNPALNNLALTYMYIDEETTEELFYVLHVVYMCLGSHTCTYTVQVLIRSLFTSQVHPKAIY